MTCLKITYKNTFSLTDLRRWRTIAVILPLELATLLLAILATLC
jgi:hypothetical protein